jgi:hypothetical protein
MPIGYKYVERDAQDTQINWAEVGANFSGMLQEENRVREEKKDALDEQARVYQNSLNSIPTGQNTQLNDAALNFAADLQEQALMLNKNLKAGLLSPRDYTRYMQNLMDGTNQAFGLFDDYNQEYSKKMKMVEDGTLSQVDLEIMANTESFANFQNHRLVINPDDSKVASARMIEGPDGTLVPDTNPNHLALVSVLKDRIRQTVNKFDVVGSAEQWASTLGSEEYEIVQSMGTSLQAGVFKEINDITQRGGGLKGKSPEELAEIAKKLGVKPEELKATSLFLEAQDNWAKSQVSSAVNSMAGASTLIDFMGFTKDGKQYTTTFDPKGVFNEDGSRDETVILLENKNGRVISDLTDIQQANAERALKGASLVQIDKSEALRADFMKKEKQIRLPSAYEIDRGDRRRKETEEANIFAKFYYGTAAQKQEAADYFGGLNKKIKRIIPMKDEIKVILDNGSKFSIKTKTGNTRLSQEQFVIGGLNQILGEDKEISDVNRIVRQSGLTKNATYSNVTAEGYTGPTAPIKKSNNPFKNLSVYATQQFNPSRRSSASNIVQLINAKFADIGYRAAVSPEGNVNIFTSRDDTGKLYKPNFISGMRNYIIQSAQEKGKDNPAFLKQLMDLPTGNSMSGF